MNMTLPEFIESVGAERAAKMFGVKQRTAEAWKRRERYPRPAKAPDIVAATNGAVDYKGIYGPDLSAA